jgi:hypothetical protein
MTTFHASSMLSRESFGRLEIVWLFRLPKMSGGGFHSQCYFAPLGLIGCFGDVRTADILKRKVSDTKL